MSELLCTTCFAELRPNAQFCTRCGRRSSLAWRELRGLFLLFAASLFLLGVTLALQSEGEAQRGDGLLTAAFAAISLIAALCYRATVWPLVASSGFTPRISAIVVAAALPIALAISWFADSVNAFFGIAYVESYPLWSWELFSYVLAAPLCEELLFRGAFLGVLRRHLPLTESLVISSFAFAIIHCSVVSLVTHVPMGLYFGWLSVRSRSLWPGVLAHAAHNALVMFAL